MSRVTSYRHLIQVSTAPDLEVWGCGNTLKNSCTRRPSRTQAWRTWCGHSTPIASTHATAAGRRPSPAPSSYDCIRTEKVYRTFLIKVQSLFARVSNRFRVLTSSCPDCFSCTSSGSPRRQRIRESKCDLDQPQRCTVQLHMQDMQLLILTIPRPVVLLSMSSATAPATASLLLLCKQV